DQSAPIQLVNYVLYARSETPFFTSSIIPCILARSLHPSVSTPLARSTPSTTPCLRSVPTLTGEMPPATKSLTQRLLVRLYSSIKALRGGRTDQSKLRPVPPTLWATLVSNRSTSTTGR